jgi:hypothetical protein
LPTFAEAGVDVKLFTIRSRVASPTSYAMPEPEREIFELTE